MNINMNVRSWFKRANDNLTPLRDPALAALYGVGPQSGSFMVTESKALTITAVYAAVNLLSETISTLPINIYRKVPAGREKATDDYRYDLLHYQPNRFQNSEEWRETMLRTYLLRGRALAEIVTDKNGRITDLFPINPDSILNIFRTSDGIGYKLNRQTKPILMDSEVIDFRGPTLDGVNCLSPIRQNANTLGVAYAANEFAGTFFKQGGPPRGGFRSKTTLDDNGWERLNGAMNRIKAHEIPLFEEDIEWINCQTMSPEDSQLLESRQYSVADIARIWRIPPHKLGDLSRATFSNIEQQNIDFTTDSLLPRIIKFDKAIDKALFSVAERTSLYVKTEVKGLLRGDSAARSEWYRTMWNLGVLSVNEIRESEDLNSVDGGDERYRPVNTTLLDTPVGVTNNGTTV
jgi:HK97 family phage portal protein